ncbi:MAG: Rrf2 family transcriptional regulator [Caldimicrobium sp.]|nr:Rrf2 family transcriptional regulator [Caldimicrobium sp.]MDW8094387.1 Rrf2 family transcriptional regulator [Caldimicrobium sp.]
MEFGILEDYAVRMVLYLAKNPQKVASRAEISKAMDIPMSVLARIGQTLENAGIVEIHRGKKGGYRLRRPPENITLLSVLESFVGRIAINRCVDNPNICPRDDKCPVNFVWKNINEKFRQLLEIDFAYILSLEEKQTSS